MNQTMNTLTAHRLRFEVEALTPVVFDDYTGSALRGALIQALQRPYCLASEEERATAYHREVCPVCWLLAYESEPGEARRPYSIEPILCSQRRFEPGQRFTFGLTLFGRAINLLPYLVLAVPEMGRAGVGKWVSMPESRAARDRGNDGERQDRKARGSRHLRTDAPPQRRRGRFVLRRIEAANPLTGERQTVMGEGQTVIQMPQNAVTNELVEAQARRLAGELDRHRGRLTITFLTPTRIVEKKELWKTPRFRPLFQRLFERVVQLCEDFGGAAPQVKWDELQPWAEAVELVEDRTKWWDVHGHSRRLGRPQPIGGLVGRAVYRAEDWRALLPWLLWGVCVHVGKNVVKGSGMITIRAWTKP